MMTTSSGRRIYDAFQLAKLEGWDGVISSDVVINSPAGQGIQGLATFKSFINEFTALAYQIDLLDEYEWIDADADGSGRGFITFNLHWKHSEVFGTLPPTGRAGTSVENMVSPSRTGSSRGSMSRIPPPTSGATYGTAAGRCRIMCAQTPHSPRPGLF